MLTVVCVASVVVINPVEVSAKNKYKKGDYITFGTYEQDNDTSNGAEPIEWEVLDVKGGKALVISKYILDAKPYAKPYDEKDESITWEKCFLRRWLNKSFYNSAFKNNEKKKILKTTIPNPNNECCNTIGGLTTKDNVFLLSVPEIIKYYKFSTWYDEYMIGYSQALLTEGTAYAIKNGAYAEIISEPDYYGFYKSLGYKKSCVGRTGCAWWLRSPGFDYKEACFVNNIGEAGWDNLCSYAVYENAIGVRPAMWIKL